MNDYFASGWKKILAFNDLHDFEALWELKADWFEPPNHRRGGWSGVARIQLKRPDGGVETVFLKRQQNHTRKTWRNPIAREPTFRQEARNLRRLQDCGVAAPELVFYQERNTNQGWQVILATRELVDYLPLDRLIELWATEGWTGNRTERRAVLDNLASLLSRLHACRLSHNALHPKHIFVRRRDCCPCLIDLEKMHGRFSRKRALQRDLEALNRRVQRLSRTDRLRFLLRYLGVSKVDARARRLIDKLLAITRRKLKGKTG